MADPGYAQIQYQFAAHLRDPKRSAPPAGLEQRRTDLYCELSIANVRGFLSENFPVLRKLHDDAAWEHLVRDFFARHRSRTPLFSRLPVEFVDFLANERDATGDPPFLQELAHYEWMESALRMDDMKPGPGVLLPDGDLLNARPVLSPLAWPLVYRFPVHRIGPDFRPAQVPPEPTYLLIYRHRDDDVRFMELNIVAARLVQLLREETADSGLQLLQQIAAELGHVDPDTVLQGGSELLRQWRDRQIVLGVRVA